MEKNHEKIRIKIPMALWGGSFSLFKVVREG